MVAITRESVSRNYTGLIKDSDRKPVKDVFSNIITGWSKFVA